MKFEQKSFFPYSDNFILFLIHIRTKISQKKGLVRISYSLYNKKKLGFIRLDLKKSSKRR